jgi:TonB-dependent receptor
MRVPNPLVLLAVCAFLILVAGSPAAFAQVGTVTGTVLDRATGEALPGANVRVQGTSLGAATDPRGRFTITLVPSGPQALVATYLGYQAETQELQVPPGGSATVDFRLLYGAIEAEEVVVTAQVAGQLAAVNEQFRNPTIVNVVSRDRIQELPDNNAAESIGRLPGIAIQRSGGEANRVAIRGLSPQYNTVTVNGVRLPSTDGGDRSVDLSLVSSNTLDGIEVRKAITPDMDADVVGGSIDLRLRNAPVGRHVDLLAQGGYTGLQHDLGNFKVVGTASERFLNDRLGVIATFNADRYNRSADKLGVNYVDASIPGTNERGLRVNGLNLREETVNRGRMGGSLLLDVALPGGRAMANTFYNQLSNDAVYRYFNPTTAGVAYSVEDRTGTVSILTSSLGAEQTFGWVSYDAQASYTLARSRSPHDYTWRFQSEANPWGVADTLWGHGPEGAFSLLQSDPETPLTDLFVDSRRLDEDQMGVSLNVRAPFRFGGWVSGRLQAGGRLRWLDRVYDIDRYGRQGLKYPGLWDAPYLSTCLSSMLGAGWEDRLGLAYDRGYLPVSSVLSGHTREEDFLGGQFGLGYVPDLALLRQLTRAYQEACSEEFLNLSITSIGDDYEGTERYQAGYVMARVDVGRYVTLIPGVRYESDHSRYVGQRFRQVNNAWREGPPAGLEELVVDRDNVFWLPMVHLDVRPLDWLSFRMARTETISRPSYQQYAPISWVNSTGSFIRAANSLLRPAHATNYDASIQVINGAFGLVGVSGFHKTIEDLVLQVQMPVNAQIGAPEGTNVPESWLSESPQLQTFINNEDPTTFYGFEVEWQTNFWWLPGAFRGLVLNLNYTRTFSETTYRSFVLEREFVPGSRPPRYNYNLVTTERQGRMPDQAAHIANATLGFDYGGFSARLSYLFQSNTASYINPRQPLLDGFVGNYSRFDMALRQNVGRGVEVFANLNNLNNRPDRTFTGQDRSEPGYTFNERHPSYRELYGYSVDLGARYRF